MKRIFIPVEQRRKPYKLFVDDLKKIYKAKKGALPPLPKYTDGPEGESGKEEVDTEFDMNSEEMRE